LQSELSANHRHPFLRNFVEGIGNRVRLGKKETEPALRVLAKATALVPCPFARLGKPEFVGLLPVGADVVNHDWLIAELLRREASLLIHKTTARSPPAPSSAVKRADR